MPSLSYSQEPPPVALRPFGDESMGGWLEGSARKAGSSASSGESGDPIAHRAVWRRMLVRP